MKENKECKIVQDLLPNYIDGLLNNESKEYVEKHLEECKECTNILTNMKENIKTNDTKIEKREVNYLKKFKNKMRILKTILLIIIIIIILVIGRRIIIVTNLANKAENVKNLNNYYARTEGIFGEEYRFNECYYKDGNYIVKMVSYSEKEGKKEIIFYKNGNEQLLLTDSEFGKKISRETSITAITPLPYYNGNEAICMALAYGVEKTNLGEIECYVLKDKGQEQYIDKDTGLLVKQINRASNTVTDYKYEFGAVKDEDIQLPDLSEYENIES